MGANTTVYVKVLRLVEDYVEVSALTTQDGMERAARLPGVAHVVEAQYEPFQSGCPVCGHVIAEGCDHGIRD